MVFVMNRHETEAKINATAWKNPDFKKKLLKDPKAALQEMGMKNLPKDLKIDVVIEEKNHWCIVVHEPPKSHEALSQKELENFQAGDCQYIPGVCTGG